MHSGTGHLYCSTTISSDWGMTTQSRVPVISDILPVQNVPESSSAINWMYHLLFCLTYSNLKNNVKPVERESMQVCWCACKHVCVCVCVCVCVLDGEGSRESSSSTVVLVQ